MKRLIFLDADDCSIPTPSHIHRMKINSDADGLRLTVKL